MLTVPSFPKFRFDNYYWIARNVREMPVDPGFRRLNLVVFNLLDSAPTWIHNGRFTSYQECETRNLREIIHNILNKMIYNASTRRRMMIAWKHSKAKFYYVCISFIRREPCQNAHRRDWALGLSFINTFPGCKKRSGFPESATFTGFEKKGSIYI